MSRVLARRGSITAVRKEVTDMNLKTNLKAGLKAERVQDQSTGSS